VPDAFVYSAVRTPVGRHGGVLAEIRPDDLAAAAVRAAVDRVGFDPARLDDVILGCANQAGEDNRNIARMAALLAGFPVEVPGQTVNRLCGSGLQAAASAAQAVKAGEGEAFVAGGVESMTRAPYVVLKRGTAWDRTPPETADSTVGWRFTNPRMPAAWTISLGRTAEVIARRYGIGRREQDAFALESQRRASEATRAGVFVDEIVPLEVGGADRPAGERADGTPRIRKGGPSSGRSVVGDEAPRPDVTLEQLAKLPPAFEEGGTVTAATSSGINDGAAALLVGTPTIGSSCRPNTAPIARIVTTAVAGVDPGCMGLGPIPATRKALARAGLSVADLDLIELNEAFAAQAIACIRELAFDPTKVNIYGGAIALGHPLGATGAKILTTLVHGLRRVGGRYGLATMCIGVGQGIAMIVERV
jgi:acetyl-CoA acetyltransferase family protein